MIAGRSGKRWANEPWCEHKPQEERQTRPHNYEPSDLAALVAGEKLLCFGSSQKHEQQQAQPVDKVQYVALSFCALNKVGNRRQPPKDGIAENHSGKDFAHDFRLAHFNEQPPQKLSEADKKQKKNDDLSQIRIGHCSHSKHFDASSAQRFVPQSGLSMAHGLI